MTFLFVLISWKLFRKAVWSRHMTKKTTFFNFRIRQEFSENELWRTYQNNFLYCFVRIKERLSSLRPEPTSCWTLRCMSAPFNLFSSWFAFRVRDALIYRHDLISFAYRCLVNFYLFPLIFITLSLLICAAGAIISGRWMLRSDKYRFHAVWLESPYKNVLGICSGLIQRHDNLSDFFTNVVILKWKSWHLSVSFFLVHLHHVWHLTSLSFLCFHSPEQIAKIRRFSVQPNFDFSHFRELLVILITQQFFCLLRDLYRCAWYSLRTPTWRWMTASEPLKRNNGRREAQ